MLSRLKDFRRIATRYDRLATNFLAGYACFQMAEAALPRQVFAGILTPINGLRGQLP